jgi:peptidoglycan/LPS O-acetylase OafA/YrhL
MPHGLELGWTLASEMTFYLIAPLVFRSKILPAIILGTSVAVRIGLNLLYPQHADGNAWEAYCYYFLPSTILFFMLGHVARQLYRKFRLPERVAWPVLGSAMLVCLIQDGRFGFDNFGFYLSILLFALAMPAVFAATKDNRFCNSLGDLIYPLYLSHGVMIVVMETQGSLFYGIFHRFISTAAEIPIGGPIGIRVKAALISITIWLIAILIAMAVHWLIERPATMCMRAALAARITARSRPSRETA